VRDFLYIDDAVRLIALLARLERGSAPFVVNGGTGVAVTVKEVAEALCREVGAKAEIAFSGAERTGDPQRLVADPALAAKIGFSPEVPFAAGVARLSTWVQCVTGDRSLAKNAATC
jgi:UDP-glucose 4-epimerase